MKEFDIKFMKIAIREAKKGLGKTSPNPAVGAVIVKEGKILSKGYHKKAGLPHAEIEALKKIGWKAEGATLYVTLEPCNHWGRTPPCTEAILKSGIKRVVIGMKDPNPHVKGGGAEFLKERGIEVEVGILEDECYRLNEHYVKFVKTHLPFVAVKVAMTLDGWIATATKDSKWITNERSRRFVHRLRSISDAVLVGIDTVISDNPLLTVRHVKGKDPVRIILDSRLRIPEDANVIRKCPSNTVIVAAKDFVSEEKAKRFEEKTGANVLLCRTKNGKIDLKELLFILGKKDIMFLLVEGGSKVIGSFINEGLVDKFFIFFAPKILGGSDGIPMAYGKGPCRIRDSLSLTDVKVRRFMEDILIEGYPKKTN